MGYFYNILNLAADRVNLQCKVPKKIAGIADAVGI